MKHAIHTFDDAADTLRFVRPNFDLDAPTDPDATSIYDIHDIDTAPVRHVGQSSRTVVRRRMIRETRETIAGLRDAIAAGWNVGPELTYEQRRLAALEAG
jgi:hypothetical protein